MKREEALQILYNHSTAKECTVLIGARQTGKTTLLKQLEQQLSQEGKTTVFLNLERAEILAQLNEKVDNIWNYCPKQKEKVYVLIDEVQYLRDPSNFIKLIFDEYATSIKLIVTGSSAFYIDKKFRDSLAGRKKIIELYTLNFEEMLAFRQEEKILKDYKKLQEGTILKTVHQERLHTLLEEYIIYGGYPAVVLENNSRNKIELLHELKNAYIKKDVLESNVREEEKFFKTIQLLATQVGALVNVHELANTIRTTNATIDNFLYVLQKCFHVQLVKPYYNNLRKELTKMPKVYFNDTGLRNALVHNFNALSMRADKGQLFENYIYTSLRNKHHANNIKFWRTADGNEIDFILENNKQAVEVKYTATENKPSKYKKFIATYPEFELVFENFV